ncbi:MAG: hypothetical protein LBK56_01420 [Gracilibacteraceae bacterium]|nr:hypothetical protein [Gracilibacteraceae bacterium]
MPAGKNKIIIIGAVAALAVIGALVAVIIRLTGAPAEPVVIGERSAGVGTVATIENIDAIRQAQSEPVQDGYYASRMNVEWSFPDGTQPSPDAYVANSESNTRTVYFTVLLDETDELIYTSPDIPVGSQLTGFALDKALPKGEYPAVAVYHLLDDDGNELSTVSVTVKLYIIN